MALRALSTLLPLFALLRRVTAQIGPDPRWLKPDGSSADFSSTFTAGDTIILSWKALNNSDSDLYLTHWDPVTYPWHSQIATNFDVSAPGTLKWYIDVPAYTIANDNRFVLRFYPKNVVYGVIQFPQLDSPGFYLAGGVDISSSAPAATETTSSSTSSQPTQTTKPTSATSETSATSSVSTHTTASFLSDIALSNQSSGNQTTVLHASTTEILTFTNAVGSIYTATVTTSTPSSTGIAGTSQSESSSGLSLGAQAGIGVAGGIVIIILFIIGCFFGRRVGRHRVLHGSEHGLEREGFPMQRNNGAPLVNSDVAEYGTAASTTGARPQTANESENAQLIHQVTLNDDEKRWYNSRGPWVEVKGDNNFPVEMSGVMVRPGLHEVG